jgi:hypothetical protein
MTHWIKRLPFFIIPLFSLIPASAQQSGQAPPEFVNWLPLSDSERQQPAPSVDKDAGAEILLWRVHVVDEFVGGDPRRALYHYVRLKIFNEQGKEKAATIDLPYREPGGILDVSGRTIKPDGTIVELDRKTVFKRDLVRVGGRKEKVVSFAMPAIEPGAIAEYRWRQTENDNRFRYLRLHFAREFPVQKVTYFVRPLSHQYVSTDQMFLMPFNCRPTPVKPTNDGWNETTLTNVAAWKDEPYAPSDPNLEPWALLYYREGGPADPEKYWAEIGKKRYSEFKSALKTNDDQNAAAASSLSAAKTDEQKISALVTYVRKNVRSILDPKVSAAEMQEFFKKLPKDRLRTSAEILKGGLATPYEMGLAFAGLAAHAGLEARPALIANLGEIRFDPKAIPDRYFLDDESIAVKTGASWKLFDVGSKNLEPGMLRWEDEGTSALIGDPKAPFFLSVPSAPPDASSETRTAHLKLTLKGSLEGDVEQSYTGHRAEQLRAQLGGQSPEQREEWLRDLVVRMFPDAEVTAVKLEHIDDSTQPLTAGYHLDAPSFAQVTGKRILFQPNAFRRAQGSMFSASERRFPVQFPYAWKEAENISIALPEGFELDNAESPGNLDFGEPGSYKFNISVAQGPAPSLLISRELVFGDKGLLFFAQANYGTLKKIFDEIQVRDAHSISLKGN